MNITTIYNPYLKPTTESEDVAQRLAILFAGEFLKGNEALFELVSVQVHVDETNEIGCLLYRVSVEDIEICSVLVGKDLEEIENACTACENPVTHVGCCFVNYPEIFVVPISAIVDC